MERKEIKELLKTLKFHYFNVHDGGVITVATVQNKFADHSWCAASFCSPQDRFEKAIGRLLAYRRLIHTLRHHQYDHYITSIGANNAYVAVFLSLLSHEKSTPNWLIRKIKQIGIHNLFTPRVPAKYIKKMQKRKHVDTYNGVNQVASSLTF